MITNHKYNRIYLEFLMIAMEEKEKKIQVLILLNLIEV